MPAVSSVSLVYAVSTVSTLFAMSLWTTLSLVSVVSLATYKLHTELIIAMRNFFDSEFHRIEIIK